MNTEAVLALCSGNAEAVQFIEGFWAVMECWDDMIDRDKPADDDAINRMMIWAMFGMQDNRFYQANQLVLRTAMLQAIASWWAANKFEKSGDRALVEQAYFLRCSAYDVFSTVALLTGGLGKQQEAVEYFRAQGVLDTLESYMREHLGD